MIEIKIAAVHKPSDIVASLKATEPQLQQVTMRALNKTARWLRAQISRKTADELNIKVGLVRNSLTIVRAKRGSVNATVGMGRRQGVINAINLGAARKNARGVRVARRQYDHAFLATMPTGHRGIFWRTGDDRLPIREVQVVVTGRMAKVMEGLADRAALDYFDKVFQHEINFILRQS